eukprot:TRINITY_DN12314_c0_g1_i2.p1 TRINITY_DN12314_c0_g1~~TRINITY_DN12314_c0_g1_i2.p1  ORF type:complete len:504 (-),score=74.13 TRINITY_DN12314_c0_g1_i2:86-1597(-)
MALLFGARDAAASALILNAARQKSVVATVAAKAKLVRRRPAVAQGTWQRRCGSAASAATLGEGSVAGVAEAPEGGSRVHNAAVVGASTVAQFTRVSDGRFGEGRAVIASPTKSAAETPSVSAWWRQERGNGGVAGAGSHVANVLDTEQLGRLSAELEAMAAELSPHEQLVAQKDEFLGRLQTHISAFIDGAEVKPFGSAVNGLWTPHSDVDVCVRVRGASTRNQQLQMLRKIAGELTRVTTHHVEPRFGAQVPILHWAPKRPGMVACDISINNTLAVVNSRLLAQYTKMDDRLCVLGRCLKVWAEARGINDRFRGTLSSFALSLMLIHFLQRVTPPALPSLQDIAVTRGQPPEIVVGVDCRYCVDPEEIEGEMKYLRAGKPPNEDSVGQLLLDFVRYFGDEYRHGIIRIRDTRSLIPPIDESRKYFFVDNPFEVGKDVANVSDEHNIIRKEFRRAWSLLAQGRSFREVLRSDVILGHRGDASGASSRARQRPLSQDTSERRAW